MCLAIYKPANVAPDWEAFSEGFKNNPDGAGFAVVDDGNLLIRKGFFTFGEFMMAFAGVASKQAIIHFRVATHGDKRRDNCHPFEVRPGLSVIHNGILPIACNVNKAMSDTWHYTSLILAPLAERDPDFFTRPEMVFLGEAAIKGSKFVFLRADGSHAIWNEDDGHWAAGAWWSNRSYDNWLRPSRDRFSFCDSKTESEYRDFLSGEVAWAYDDLLELGYTHDDLDEMLRTEGDEALIAYAEEELAAKED